MSLYTKDGKKVDVEVTICDIIEVINYNDDFVDKMIEENPSNYRYGLSFHEFLFLCLDLKNPKILNEFENIFYDFYYKYSKEVEYVEYISILEEKSKGYSLPEFELNPKLFELLIQNMNPNYNNEEKLIYFYFKLCFILSIDTLYNFACIVFGDKGFLNFKKSSNRLQYIDNINNNVACFEFTAIFDRIIKMYGEYAASWPYTGDKEHVNTEAIINKKLYKFDALEDPHGRNVAFRDLLNVKLNRGYDGIVAGADDFIQGLNSHFPYIDNIYKDVQKEFSYLQIQKKFNNEILLECFSNIQSLNLDEKTKQLLRKYFLKFNSIPLNGIEYYIEVISSYKPIIEYESGGNIQLTGVGSTIDDYDFKLVLSIKSLSSDYIYFLFGKDTIQVLTKEQIMKMFEENAIIITQGKDVFFDENGNKISQVKYRTIPGIDEEFQVLMNKQAEITVLWPMLQQTYNDSLGIDSDNKKLSKTGNK